MHPAGERETHYARVIDDDDDDRQGAEKIEARLALAIREARVDSEPEGRFSFGSGLRNAARLEMVFESDYDVLCKAVC
jgi:hypothetical protein